MRPQPLARVLAAPAAVAGLSLAGLVAALAGDGWLDLAGWAGAGLPLAIIAWALVARRT